MESHVATGGGVYGKLAGFAESFELFTQIDPVAHLGIGEEVLFAELPHEGL
jgi:hypothetical protein